jgi:UDP-N-acetylmuramoyl-L-alanyl-D-glutamate--2,6-diaminopimelate ligase
MDLQSISLRDSPCPVSFIGCGDIRGTHFSNDSRSIRRGEIFVAVRGTTVDGHDFLNEVVASGAAAVIVERPFPNLNLAQCVVRDTRRVWAWIAMRRLGNPAERLSISGVTGTNGKTTVTWMLRAILRQAGFRTGLVGTIEYSDGQHTHPSGMTTPDAVELAMLFRQMVSVKASHCVMEISSHALDQQRCSDLQLAAGALTNITQDHFDYHGGFDSYLNCSPLMSRCLLELTTRVFATH